MCAIVLWLIAAGLIILGISGLSGRGVRWTRETTLHGRQAKIVGVVCILGGMLISPPGIVVIGMIVTETKRASSRRVSTPASTDNASSTAERPAPPPPPPPPSGAAPPADAAETSDPPTDRITAWRRGAFAKGGRLAVRFRLMAYNATGDQTEAAREALSHVSWAVADEVHVDPDTREIVVPCRSPRIDPDAAKTLLQEAGFQISGTTEKPEDR